MLPIQRLFGPFFLSAGIAHFAIPKPFQSMVPDYLPAHRELVQVSGVVEGVAGIATMVPRTRRWGRLLSIATLVAVFPANVNMALHPEKYPVPGGRAALIARLPLQGLLIWWAAKAE
ncbi:hypothetical protein [Patulibacter sp.]|uniref:DoxX family protein n=1 Tax=Patulibacter sp. TaxID=1912859 RepID=UPI00271DDC76|nr:hypothetical protein [Patulibacter sp.]MDO9409590.1 hypothetical protein [Patulibacter sp.]